MTDNLERLRELRSSKHQAESALNPLNNRFPEEMGVIFWFKMAKEECERRIEEVKEVLDE